MTSLTRSWHREAHRRVPRRLSVLAAMAPVAVALTLLASCAWTTPSAAPSSYQANLWPQRPVVQLSFEVAPDLGSVTGRESVVFTPDMPACELVFRAWPNNPTISKAGSSLTLTDSAVNGHPVAAQVQAAGAPPGAPGTLIQLPLSQCLQPGQSVRADLGFTVVLGRDADERVGYSPDTRTAWFGSAFPLLGWIRGQGWARDPAVPMNGETAVSEEFALTNLSVTAPSDDQVTGTGTAGPTVAGDRPGTATHRFSAAAVRDVAVGVGHYNVTERDVNGVRVHLATPATGTKTDPTQWGDVITHAIEALSTHFGPFPYADFWATITPGQSDGTEYPQAVQFGDAKEAGLSALVAHELSHQWFYSLVGNNQAEDPWLDESLATLGEALVGGDAKDYRPKDISDRVVGLMGKPMSYWAAHGGFGEYTEGVYNQGGAVLLEARKRVGADRFDAALRSYIQANAHRVARPADFARAFADQPQVLDLLKHAGALPNPG
ncbi:MAG TPA: M1 family aminopeptidase [Pseudonocardiaceae bacterium]|nr:M1 family aminopeptidase [Pseudonocardiaceae bacterium]